MSLISNNSFPFFGIGAEKAATSWIFACLYEHPQVCIPVKELNFFTKTNLYQKGLDWFFEFYSGRCDNKMVFGEYSTSYLYDPNAAIKIHKTFPHCKFIVSLRNPIDRAYSNYLNDIMAGEVSTTSTFEEVLKNKSDYLEKGKYNTHLKVFYDLFQKSQIHITLYEDIKNEPLQVIHKLYRFLEVDDAFVPPSVNKKYNASLIPKKVELLKMSNKIANYLQHHKWTNKIWWAIKQSGIPEKIRTSNSVKDVRKISTETYNKLIPYFAEDIEFVSKLTNRRLNWGDER